MHLSTIEPNSGRRCRSGRHAVTRLVLSRPIITRQVREKRLAAGRTCLIEIHLEASRVAIGSVSYDKWPKKEHVPARDRPQRSKIATRMLINAFKCRRCDAAGGCKDTMQFNSIPSAQGASLVAVLSLSSLLSPPSPDMD